MVSANDTKLMIMEKEWWIMPEVLTFVDYARRRGGLGLGDYNTK